MHMQSEERNLNTQNSTQNDVMMSNTSAENCELKRLKYIGKQSDPQKIVLKFILEVYSIFA